MSDLCEIVKEIEKETGNPCEIKLKITNEKIKEEVYGNLKGRECTVIADYRGSNKEIKEDIEKLRGDYKNFNVIGKKIRELGFESYSRKEEEKKLVEEIEKKAHKLSTKKTLFGSTSLFESLLGKIGVIKIGIILATKNKKEESEKKSIEELEKILKANVGVFYDINEKTKYMKKEFRENNLDFLNSSYLVQDDGIYLHTADLHPGFMMGAGDKVARIKYALLDKEIKIKGKEAGGGCCGTGTP